MHEIVLETERKLQLIEVTDQIRDALGDTNGATAALIMCRTRLPASRSTSGSTPSS